MSGLKDVKGRSFRRRDAEASLLAILKSEQFSGTPQLADFLTYIVTKTLDGEKSDLKAYTIAVDALGRDEDFDPQTNAAVRVAAGRLRQALALYNARQDIPKKIKITLEPGSYVPSFETVEENSPPGNEHLHFPKKKAVLVPDEISKPVQTDPLSFEAETSRSELIFESDGSNALDEPALFGLPETEFGTKVRRSSSILRFGSFVAAATLLIAGAVAYFLYGQLSAPHQEIAAKDPANLPQFKSVELSKLDANLRPSISALLLIPDVPYPDWFKIGELADSISINIARFDDYRFTGVRVLTQMPLSTEIQADYHLLVTAYHRDEKVIFFAQLMREADDTVLWSIKRTFERPRNLSDRNVANLVGQIFSPIGSPYGIVYVDMMKGKLERSSLNCSVLTNRYFFNKSDKLHAEARDCAERLIEQGSALPSVHATLTFIHLDEYREGRNRRNRDPLEAAKKAANRAIQLGPLSARAHQAMFAVYKVQGLRDLARKSAEKALQLNPFDTDIIGDYAAWLVSIGQNERGRDLLKQIETLQDARPAWLEFYRFLSAELDQEFDTANEIASMMDVKRSPLLAMAVTIGAHRQGRMVEKDQALEELRKSAPGLAADPKTGLMNRGFDPKIADQLVSKLVEAGLAIK